MFRRLLPLIAAIATGCSYNPGYFPYEVPGGPVVQSHAKPRLGFFRDFDPKAHRLEVTPKEATAPLGAQIVLVATVFDKDGDPRRSRRVEWILEGPGSIIEVDEAGLYASRGYKVDNKYGVTHTCYVSHTITRGNDDPKDDVELCPGQTFCVVSSAVPGETTITAYAPGVFNWEKGRVVSKITWGEGRFSFPAPTAARYGTEATLSTALTSIEQNSANAPNFKVRYRLLDGDSVAAAFQAAGGSGTSLSQAGISAKEAETTLDSAGAATVKIVQPSPQVGKTRVAVEVIKPAENGVGPGVVVSRRETTVEWTAPDVKLDVTSPAASSPNTTVPVTVALANVGKVDARESRVRVTLTDGATLEKSEPPPVKQENGALVFDLPALGAGKKQELALQVRPAKEGSFTVGAEVATGDGLQGRKEATTRVEAGKLGLHVDAPAAALAGDKVAVKVAVTNTGASAANNAIVWAQFDQSLTHESGKNPAELSVGTLAAGQTKVVELPLTAKTIGKYSVRATATADGNLTAAAEPVRFEVRRAELNVAAVGPKLAYKDSDFTWVLTVANSGDGPVNNVLVRASLPAEVKLRDAGDGKAGAGTIEWALPTLKAGEKKELKASVDAMKIGDRATLSVVVTADATGGGGGPVGDPIQARTESTVAIIGTAAVSVELLAPTGLVETGKKTTFQVRVKNKGTISAHNIDVTAFAPAELKATRAFGQAEGRIAAGGTIAFPVVEELRPGEILTFTIEADAVQTGDGRLRAEVKAAELTATLKEEQPVRVIGR